MVSIACRSVSVRGVAGLLRGLYGQAAPGAGVEPAPARLDTYRLPSVREAQDDGAGRVPGNRVPPLPAPSGLGGLALPAGAPPGVQPGMPPGAAPMARAPACHRQTRSTESQHEHHRMPISKHLAEHRLFSLSFNAVSVWTNRTGTTSR